MEEIGLNDKLKAQAKLTVEQAFKKHKAMREVKGLDEFLEGLVYLSLKKGFSQGLNSIVQTSTYLLKELK